MVMQKFDIYLSRISQIVQIGLFATTLLTIYYTVIPLYKSAQLEESLARKETEYELLSVRAKEILEKVNSWEYRDFRQIASECSGVPDILFKNKKPKIGDRPPAEVSACLQETLVKFKFTDLNSEKKFEIYTRVSGLRPALESIYQKHLNMYDDYPSKIDQDLRDGKIPSSAINEIDKLLGGLGYRVGDNQKRDSYIYSGRLDVTYQYFSEVSEAIRSALGEKL